MAREGPMPGDLIEEVGLGRSRQKMFELLALLGLLGTASGWGTAYYEIKAEPAVERIPLVYDSNLQLIGQLGGPVDPQLLDQLSVQNAKDWLVFYRSRSRDRDTMTRNRVELARRTDQKLWPRLGEKLNEHQREFGISTIEVPKIGGNLVNRIDPYRRTVYARWSERVLGGLAEEREYSATLTVTFVPRAPLDEWGTNASGFYITDYQPSEIER